MTHKLVIHALRKFAHLTITERVRVTVPELLKEAPVMILFNAPQVGATTTNVSP